MFPAALIDLLVVYLNLLYPLPGTDRVATSPRSICVCGDSSGGNIALSFLQLLLHLQRQSPSGIPHVLWDGQTVEVPCPRVVVSHSGYLDLTRSLQSETENLKYDIIPSAAVSPFPRGLYLQDDIWPASSPRNHVYAPNDLLTHPLVSPVAARNWECQSTAVLLSVGQECLADGSILLAKRMAEQGIAVRLECYNGMPHDLIVAMPFSKYGQECLNSWATFAKEATSGTTSTAFEKPTRSRGVIWDVYGQNHVVDIDSVPGPQMTPEEVIKGMKETMSSWEEPPQRSGTQTVPS